MSRTADLSVIMPTYNHAQYLPRALDALLSQSVRPKELLVVNDASPDETRSILEQYGKNHSVIKVIHNDSNLGVNKGVCVGFAQATGKYVYVCASDDYVLPGFIEKLTGELDRHPEAGLCSSYFSIVNEESGEIHPNPSGWCDSPRYFSPGEVESRIGHSSIPGHASILKRSSFDAAGGFLTDLEWHSDWFLNYVVAFRDGICHVPEMLSLLTEVPSSYATRGSQSDRQLAVINAIIDRLASAEYADVAPAFQRSGALSVLGLPVLVAAAARPDAWSRSTLSLLNSFSAEQYEALLEHPDAAVRDLAGFFLGAYWQESKQVREQQAASETLLAEAKQEASSFRERTEQLEQDLAKTEQKLSQMRQSLSLADLEVARMNQTLAERDLRMRYLESVVEHHADVIHRMESSYFWKSRKALARCKHAVLAPLNHRPRLAS